MRHRRVPDSRDEYQLRLALHQPLQLIHTQPLLHTVGTKDRTYIRLKRIWYEAFLFLDKTHELRNMQTFPYKHEPGRAARIDLGYSFQSDAMRDAYTIKGTFGQTIEATTLVDLFHNIPFRTVFPNMSSIEDVAQYTRENFYTPQRWIAMEIHIDPAHLAHKREAYAHFMRTDWLPHQSKHRQLQGWQPPTKPRYDAAAGSV